MADSSADTNLKCRKCGSQFFDKSSLNRHLRNRHGKKPKIKCPECHNKFARAETLKNHMRTRHNSTLENGASIGIYNTSGRAHQFAYTRTFFANKQKAAQNNEERSSETPEYGTMEYAHEPIDLLQEAINQSQLDLTHVIQEELDMTSTIDRRELNELLGSHD